MNNVLDKEGSKVDKYEFSDFKLEDVIIQDKYLKNAFTLELKYLKSLDEYRLLAGFTSQLGLSSKKLYSGWEDSEIKGHTLGHYMTALAYAYANTKDGEIAIKIENIIDCLRKCQISHGNGYVGAISEKSYDKIEVGNPAGTWVPWYTMHKIMAGLINIYQLCGYEVAREVVTNLGLWVYNRSKNWTKETRENVLAVEYGGMNDCLYELYKITGDERFYHAAERFDEMSLFEPLYNKKDNLDGLHANTTIPKILGALNKYDVMEQVEGKVDKFYLEVAENFWNIVVKHHSYATGGNSEWEHFGESEVLDEDRTECNNETCNVYNMLKLSRKLFMITGEKKYLEFYERAFFNQILASQNPKTGMTTYFQPMASGFFRVFSSPFNHFWCCTGTGMENFTKLNDSLYFRNDSKNLLVVNQYISSIVSYKDAVIRQKSDVLRGNFKSEFSFEKINSWKKQDFTIAFRRPSWIEPKNFKEKDGMILNIKASNIYSVKVDKDYIYITNTWSEEDTISIVFNPKVQYHALPDNEYSIALTYGPLVMCADLGNSNMETDTTGVDVTIPKRDKLYNDVVTILEERVDDWLDKVDRKVIKNFVPMDEFIENAKENVITFTLQGTDCNYRFIPFYLAYNVRYGVYLNYTDAFGSNKALVEKKVKQQKEEQGKREITIDSLPMTNDQYEASHNMQADKASPHVFRGLKCRDAINGGFFEYDLKVEPDKTNVLEVKYNVVDTNRRFDILIDGKVLSHVKLTIDDAYGEPLRKGFFYVHYPLSKEMVEGKEKVTVRFQSLGEESTAGGIYDVLSMLRQ